MLPVSPQIGINTFLELDFLTQVARDEVYQHKMETKKNEWVQRRLDPVAAFEKQSQVLRP
jgi:hypothetical protein